ncbi:hypothetical protein CSPHI_07265 [Corynebacterium sphenisci DSM 44792]|uniref:DNA 3'-5' helicase n=1 Tax=Corynebacterium sphenisci DSM 44792 TaxID=1437874 RepID=A0A1L7CYC9_9CORY|nr:UvrD-helicase domain-containing protein [Corynebacterium sphenisci]APT90875.1 hypothetical protein CSPHI_07265 [Corynebacterium sphenisci DSM 44792]
MSEHGTTPAGALADAGERELIAAGTGHTLFVEAGAGTGKTHSMVQRLRTLIIDDGIPVESIAAITFTEKAAAEMRARIRGMLEQEAADLGGADPAKAERLGAALDGLDGAAIETLHRFARRIISLYPLAARVPPRVEILADIGQDVAAERGWADFRARLFPAETPEDDADRTLAEAAAILVEHGIEVDDIRAVRAGIDENYHLADPDPELPDLDATPWAELRRVIADARDLGARGIAGAPTGDPLLALIRDCTRFADELAEAVADTGPGDRAWASIRLPNDGRSVHRISKADAWKGARMDGAPVKITDLRKELSGIFDGYRAVVGDRLSRCAEAIALAAGADALAAAAERRRTGRLTFHDLLVIAEELTRDPEVRDALHGRFRMILLDEFQDTDPLQWRLARNIATGAHDRVQDGHLFTVGDPKQSIYRFRRADISTYLAARDDTAAAGEEVAVNLRTNFRSTPAVIDWVNAVFSGYLRERNLPDGRRIQAGYVPLTPRPDLRRIGDADPRRGRALVFGPPRQEPGEAPRDVDFAAEAADIAELIHGAVADRWPVTTREGGRIGSRPVTYADILVLTPTAHAAERIMDALGTRGIEYRSSTSSVVYRAPEVLSLINVMRAIADPTDAVACVAALRSPLFGCSDADLLEHRLSGGGWRIDVPPASPDGDSADRGMVGEGLAWLHGLHSRRTGLRPADALEAVVEERLGYAVWSAARNREDRWRRIRFVVEQARQWYEATGGTLREYCDWVDAQSTDRARINEAIVPELGVDAVRLMTIHAAKGLEAPFVIVAGLGRGLRTDPDPVLVDAGGGLHARFRKDLQTEGYAALQEEERAQLEAERARLWYVAATRAESVLAVSGHVSWNKSGAVSGRCRGADFLAAILDAEADGAPGCTPRTVPEILADQATPEQIAAAEEPAQASPARPDPMSTEEFERRMAAARASAEIPGLASVTGLLDEGRLRFEGESAAAVAATAVGAAAGAALGDVVGAAGTPAPVPEPVAPPAVGYADHGPVFGDAMHAFLEHSDLDADTAEDGAWAAAARAHARAAGLGDADAFVARARSALESAPVRAAAAAPRHWREMHLTGVTAGADGAAQPVFGIADLVWEDDSGLLHIIDYKTDVTIGEEELARYFAQLGTYAGLLEDATGRRVADLCLVVLRDGPAEVRIRAR